MATLINRIQRAMLGSAGPEKVRALLAELAIPTSGPGEPDIGEVRRGFLRPISDEAILRNALANFGIAGGGNADPRQALGNLRNAIFRSFDAAETTLLQGLDGLLDPGDLAGGGGGAPAWVPEGAVIHIDFLGGAPQGRAWTEDDGEVGIDTLLGNDPNVDSGWGNTTVYDPDMLTADGYSSSLVPSERAAFIGAALTLLLGGATMRMVYKQIGAPGGGNPASGIMLALVAPDGNDAVEIDVIHNSSGMNSSSWGGSLAGNLPGVLDVTIGAVNGMACTMTPTRVEYTANGAAVMARTVSASDRPPGNPLLGAMFDMRIGFGAAQSITLYDPLPDTTGLSELSEIDGGGGAAFASSSVSSRSISGGAI